MYIPLSDLSERKIVLKHYQRILTSWPVDKLRPEVSFQKALQRRIDLRLEESSPTKLPQDNIVSNGAQVSVPTPKPFDEKGELGQVNALYTLLENRYTKKVRHVLFAGSRGLLGSHTRSIPFQTS